MTVLAGLRLAFEPEDGLGPRERDVLVGLRATSRSEPGQPHLRVALETGGSATASVADGPAGPAHVAWNGESLVLTHPAFEAVIDATVSTAVVRRHGDDPTGLVTTLRTALSARLPLEGGLVVHAAALERRGRGLVFFGPSGIGKSTLAQRSPWRVLSDELAAVLPRHGGGPPRVSSAAFPGPQPVGRRSAYAPRLACFIELAQGPRFHLERLERGTALRRLLGSIVVPPGPPLWSAALKVAGDLVRETPCYRMAWSLDASPFELLEAGLDAEAETTPCAGARGPRTPWCESDSNQDPTTASSLGESTLPGEGDEG